MPGAEPLVQVPPAAVGQGVRGHLERELVSLPEVAHVRLEAHPALRLRHPLVAQPGPRLLPQRLQHRAHVGRIGFVDGADVRARELVPGVRAQESEGRQHPRGRRHDDREAPGEDAQRIPVQRAGAAERDQGEVARVEALLHGDEAERAEHVLVDDVEDALRGLVDVQAEGAGDLPHRGRGGVGVQRHLPAEQARGEAAEHDVRIGHRRLLPALAVAGRPRRRPRALRPDPQRPGHGHVGDRAAPGADAVDLHRRHLDRVVAQGRLPGDGGRTVAHQGDVGRGAPHVEPQRVAMPREPGHERGAGHPAGRAGEHGMGRGIAGPGDAHQAAVGAHDVHAGAQIDGAELVVEALQVVPHARAHVGVHHRHQGAFVLPELGQDLGGERDRDIDAGLDDQRLEPLLVRVVGVGMQQRHRDRLHPGVEQLADRLAGLRLVEGAQDPAAGVDPLRDPARMLQVREGVRLLHDHPAGERPRGL